MSETVPRLPARGTFLSMVLFVLAAALIGRATVLQNPSQQPLADYETWQMPMPFQARCLMVPVLKWAASSGLFVKASQALAKTSFGPDQLMMQFVDVLCLILVGAISIRLRKSFSPATTLIWLAPFLVLWASAATFTIRYESRFYLPYDLPALLFFSLGVLACVEFRSVLLLLVIAVGTFNRETTIFLVPIWLICNLQRSRPKLFSVAALACLIWFLDKLQIRRWTMGAPSGLYIPSGNWTFLVFPHHWAQLASIGGFLVWPVILYRGLIRDPLLKRLWIGYVPYLCATMLLGRWNETRIFGELIPVVAVSAAVEFEEYLARARQLSPSAARRVEAVDCQKRMVYAEENRTA